MELSVSRIASSARAGKLAGRTYSCVFDGELTQLFVFQNTDSLPVQKCETVDAFVVVYSIDNRKSFDDAFDWYSDLDARYPDIPILLLANKTDKEYSRDVDAEEGKELAGDLFFEVSAANTEAPSLRRAFASLFRKVMRQRDSQTVKRKLSMTKKIGSIFTRKDSVRRISTSASM